MTEQPVSEEFVSSPQGEYDTLRNVTPEGPCPYLPDLQSRNEAYYAGQISGATYEELLVRGFRRSGPIIYRPRCRHCRACHQLRIPTASFVPTRSMTRVMRCNADMRVECNPPSATEHKFELYRSYLDAQHDDSMERSYEAFREFLYQSPIETLELSYLLGERLLGVSLVDCVPGGLSSVYMYFDPGFAPRSLGTFSVLWEIEYCRQRKLPYYYLGYYVPGSKTMAYKSRFRPHELLIGDARWVTLPE